MRNLFFKFVFLTILACCQFACNDANTQSNNATKTISTDSYPNLKKQAQELCDAYLNSNYAKQFDLTVSEVSMESIKKYGTKENAIASTKRDLEMVNSAGYTILKMSVGNPEKVETLGSRVFSLIPVSVENNTPQGKKSSLKYFVGVSADKGENWTFAIDFTQEKFQHYFPEASEKIKIPNPKTVD
jgi:hypothetical protein